MTTWKYNKKITLGFTSVEGRKAHESAYHDKNAFQDWYYDQVDVELADKNVPYVPYKLISDTVYEILVSDQAQVDSFVAMVSALGERLGAPIADYSATDVEYTTETIPSDYNTLPN